MKTYDVLEPDSESSGSSSDINYFEDDDSLGEYLLSKLSSRKDLLKEMVCEMNDLKHLKTIVKGIAECYIASRPYDVSITNLSNKASEA